MPVVSQASMRSVPAGTVSFLPSTERVTSATIIPLFAFHGYPCPQAVDELRQCRLSHLLERTRFAVEMVFKFLPVFLNVRNDRHRGRIAQRAKRASQHVLRQVIHIVNILRDTTARVEARQCLFDPVGALTAWNTPATALVLVELDHPQRELDNAHLVIEDDDAPRAQHRSNLEHSIEIHGHIDLVRSENLY